MQELSPTQLKARLDAGEPLVLVDIREDWEVETATFPGARHVPMGEIPGALADTPREANIVVICHHGGRSFTAGLLLEREGFRQVTNLAGGIDGWSREVDPSVPAY